MTIQKVDENFDEIEKYVRETLISTIHNFDSKEISTSINKADFFGNINLYEPNSFKFLLGERIQIKEISSFVRKIFTGESQYDITIFNKPKKQKKDIHTGTVFYENFGRFFSNENKLFSVNPDAKIAEAQSDSPESKLYDTVYKALESLNIDEDILHQFTKDMVSVKSDDNSKGYVQCILCDKQNQKGYSITTDSRGYWVTSNYLKHIKGHQQSEIKVKRNKHPKIKTVDNATKSLNATTSMEERYMTEIPEEELEGFDIENKDELQLVDEDDDPEFLDEQNVSSTVSLAIAPAFCSNQYSLDDLHTMIYSQISNQFQSIELCSCSNGIYTKQSEVKFECKNETKVAKILEIPGDGNCMYGAIAHQMFKTDINSDKQKEMAAEMRAKVVSHINENRSEFEFDLKRHVYDSKGNQTIVDVPGECDKLLLKLAKDKEWGGVETLKAVISMFNVNILIVNEKDECDFVGAFTPSFKETIILAYRLKKNQKSPLKRNHYDSVVNIEQDVLFTLTQLLAIKIQMTLQNQENFEIID